MTVDEAIAIKVRLDTALLALTAAIYASESGHAITRDLGHALSLVEAATRVADRIIREGAAP